MHWALQGQKINGDVIADDHTVTMTTALTTVLKAKVAQTLMMVEVQSLLLKI